MLASAIRNVVGEAEVRTGKVNFDVPPLVENGNTVPMTVSVSNPMTSDDYVRSIHVFNEEENPQPNIGNFYLGPRAGRAQISTRIRLPIARGSSPSRGCPTARSGPPAWMSW